MNQIKSLARPPIKDQGQLIIVSPEGKKNGTKIFLSY